MKGTYYRGMYCLYPYVRNPVCIYCNGDGMTGAALASFPPV